MKIAVGFRNGLGNFVIFTSILQCLAYHAGEPIDLILDEKWDDPLRKEIEEMANLSPFISECVSYPHEYDHSKYQCAFMSKHNKFNDHYYCFVHNLSGLDKPDYTVWYKKFYHELDFYLFEIQKQFRYKGPTFKQWVPKKTVKLSSYEKVKKIAISNGFGKSFFNFWECKSYPHWQKIIDILRDAYPEHVIFLVGDKRDKKWAKTISGAIDLTGEYSVVEVADILSQCDLFLSTDTGLAHIADAIRVKGVSLFGPTLISKNGPINNTIIPIRSPLECAPCQGSPILDLCDHRDLCMAAISPETVMAKVRMLLKN